MPRGVAPRLPREGEGSEERPERGGAPASRNVKPRLEFSTGAAQGGRYLRYRLGLGGRYLKYRPPLGAYQPSDPIWTVQNSRIAGASS